MFFGCEERNGIPAFDTTRGAPVREKSPFLAAVSAEISRL